MKVGEVTRDTSENHKKQITAMAADMVAFMNTPECGAVSGITFDYRDPGNAVGAVVHGPAAEGKANAVPASTGWSAEVFAGHVNGLNNHDNHKKAVEEVVAAAVASPIAADAAFAALSSGERNNAFIALFSPGSGASGPRTESGTLKAEVVCEGYNGRHTEKNFKCSACRKLLRNT